MAGKPTLNIFITKYTIYYNMKIIWLGWQQVQYSTWSWDEAVEGPRSLLTLLAVTQ